MKKYIIYAVIGIVVIAIIYFAYSHFKTKTVTPPVTEKPAANNTVTTKTPTALDYITSIAPLLIGGAVLLNKDGFFD